MSDFWIYAVGALGFALSLYGVMGGISDAIRKCFLSSKAKLTMMKDQGEL